MATIRQLRETLLGRDGRPVVLTPEQLRDALLNPERGRQVKRRVPLRPARLVRPPAQVLPTAIAVAYATKLRAMVGRGEAMATPRVESIYRALLAKRTDSSERMDAPPAADGEALAKALADIERDWLAAITGQVEATAATVASDVDTHQKRQLREQLLSAAGADVTTALRQRPSARAGQDPTLPLVRNMLRGFQTENVLLISSIPEHTLGTVRDVISKGLQQGKSWEDIAPEIEERFRVTRGRANLIARDQTTKLQSQLNHATYTAIGVTEYTWRITNSPNGDGRVRDGHLRLEGTRHKMNEPPITDPKTGRRAHPGEDVNCRCQREPVLDSDEIWERAANAGIV